MRIRSTITTLATILAVVVLSGSVRARNYSSNLDANEEFGPWTVAVNLGPIVNTAFGDAAPSVSADGLSLFFNSARDSGGGAPDLFVARRAAIDLPWEAAVNLGPTLNTTASEASPTVTPDGHYLFFASDRSGNFDIYVSYRSDVGNDFAWETPTPLPTPVNGPSFEIGQGSLQLPDGRLQLYFSTDRANGLGVAGLDIYLTELERDGTWTMPVAVDELNSAFSDGRPTIRTDGREVFLSSSRDGKMSIYTARRDHLWEPWSTPERLDPPVNGTGTDLQPAISRNGRTLYFTSTRPGTLGSFDLYVSTRTSTRHHW